MVTRGFSLQKFFLSRTLPIITDGRQKVGVYMINPLLTALYKFWAILPKNFKNHKNYLARHRPLVFATITLDIHS